MRVLVLVPVLARPERAVQVARSIRASDERCEPLFLCSLGDDDEIDACRSIGWTLVMPWQSGHGDYAKKMNVGYDVARTQGYDWAFLGADDLGFHKGWLDACLRAAAPADACVVGTNDMGNQRVISGRHSTHSLVHCGYLECGGVIDDPSRLLHEGYGHNYCNPPEAPIWMADLSFQPIGDVSPGDRVIGWERSSTGRPTVGTPRRSLCFADVLSVRRRLAPLVRVRMESGREFRCTADHRWLNAAWGASTSHDGSRGGGEWIVPRVGKSLLHVVDEPAPVSPELVREAAWLAGIYDGEGSGLTVASQNPVHNKVVVEEIRRVIGLLEIETVEKLRARRAMVDWTLQGGRQGYLDFLLRIDPTKREKLAALIVGWRGRGVSRLGGAPIGARRFGLRDRIASVEADSAEAEVVSMTTTSGNYVAWGYASRNCDDEFIQTAQARGSFVPAGDAYVEHLHPNWKKGAEDGTYRKGMSTFEQDRALYESRIALWRHGASRFRG